MSILDERELYKNNTYFSEENRIYGDWSPFYVTISICSLFGVFLMILNFTFCYCSQFSPYWRDRHTGNRWIQSLWTVSPHNNPPLDLSELEEGLKVYKIITHEEIQYHPEIIERPETHYQPQQYMELQKRESEI